MHFKAFRVVLILALSVGVGLLAVLSIAQTNAPREIKSRSRTEQETRAELLQFLSAAGIDAESLTAAGLSPTQVSNLVSQARVYVAENGAELRQLFQNVKQAAAGLSQTTSRNGEQSSQHTQLENAKAARDAGVAAFAAATLDGLPASVPQVTANIKANRRHPLPTKYLVVNRTPDQWNVLQNALAVLKTANSRNRPVPEATQTLVTEANATPSVAAAASALEANLQAIKTAWKAALDGQS